MRASLVLIASLVCSGVALGAPSAQDRAMAEALFREAKDLGAKGNLDEACRKFEESYSLDPTLGTKLHSAACYEELGRTASAWAAFNEAAALAAKAEDSKREKLARARIAKLEKSLPKLIIQVSEGVPGLKVSLDGHPLGAAGLGTPLPIDPGSHEVQVDAPGYEPWKTTLTVAEGPGTDTLSVPELIKAEQKSGEAHGAEPPDEVKKSIVADEGAGQRTLGYVVGGAGVLALAAGGYFGLRAKSQADDADAHCSGKFCSPAGLAGHDDAEQSALISTIGFGVGLAAVATGAILILTATPSKEQTAWVHPYAGPRGAGLSAGARF